MEPVNERVWEDDHWATPQRGLPPTERQVEVLLACVLHSSAARAAGSLGVSTSTVKGHLVSLYARTGAHNRTHAVWLLYPVLRGRLVERERRKRLMAFHVTGFSPGHVEDIAALERAWADFIRALDELAGQPFEGFIAGGDWIGDDRGKTNGFRLSAAEVRQQTRAGIVPTP